MLNGITLPANLNSYISIAAFVLGAYFLAFYLGLVIWTLRDIHSRTRDVLAQVMAVLLVLIFNIPGVLVYVLLRPRTTVAEEYDRNLTEEAILQDLEERRLCPGCRKQVDSDFVICPTCHYQLRLRCTSCGKLLNPNWDVCPYCGQEPGQEPVSAPVAQVQNTGRTTAVIPQHVEVPAAEQGPATGGES